MIAIGNVLVSDEVLQEQFVCDLEKCKGGCCEDGDAGAPISEAEKTEIDNAFEAVSKKLSKHALRIINKTGRYEFTEEFGWVTPTIGNGMCVYGRREEGGAIKCLFEEAYNEGKTTWKKPISCHLFPIKIKPSIGPEEVEYMNYMPRQGLCDPGCRFGRKLKVPVFRFLKEPILRRYGPDFFEALEATANFLEKADPNG